VGRETIERLLSGATYGWVPLGEEDLLPQEEKEKLVAKRADESFAKFQEILAKGPPAAPPAPTLLQPQGLAQAVERTKAATQEQPKTKPKRFHPLLAQGWRYCDGQLASPEDIQMLGLTPDEDQSEKEAQ
jgi:hypothetical protein